MKEAKLVLLVQNWRSCPAAMAGNSGSEPVGSELIVVEGLDPDRVLATAERAVAWIGSRKSDGSFNSEPSGQSDDVKRVLRMVHERFSFAARTRETVLLVMQFQIR